MPLLVVTFHYYREETCQSGIHPVNPERFVAQTSELARSCRCIGQAELLQVLTLSRRQYNDEPLCLITFDDGLKEQLSAWSELRRRGIPALFFAPTDPVVYGRVLDVHKLHYIRSQVDDGRLFELLDRHHGIASARLDAASMITQYPYDLPLAQKVKYFLNFHLSAMERSRFVGEVFADLVDDEQAFAESLYMNKQDLRDLADANALGAHGASHEPLAYMSRGRARRDILESLNTLETIARRPIVSFSYPYGTESAIAPHLADFLMEGGVKAGFTMIPGVNRESELSTPLFLRRLDTNDAPGGKFVQAGAGAAEANWGAPRHGGRTG